MEAEFSYACYGGGQFKRGYVTEEACLMEGE